MVTKLHPVGKYVYDSNSGELNSPDGCTLERDGNIYGDERITYSKVIQFKGNFNAYFVPTNELNLNVGGLEKKVFSKFKIVENKIYELKKFKRTISISYIIETSIGVGLILADFFSGK